MGQINPMSTKKVSGYRPPSFESKIQLHLNRNESQCALGDLSQQLENLDSRFVTRYPDHGALQQLIGESTHVDPNRIVVTAGGDDAIDRIVRTSLVEGRNQIVTHTPSFEMVDVYANLYGGTLCTIPWVEGEFPTTKLVEQIDHQSALVVITSPNNPTGGLIPPEAILQINAAARRAGVRLLVDFAYVEFAELDPTEELARDDNILIVRTFSKAWGLAGLRVGYLIAPTAEFAETIRNASGPFPVSHVSLEIARLALTHYRSEMESNVHTTKCMRQLVSDLISHCGGKPLRSEGNFVLGEFDDAEQIWSGLAEDGIGIRKFPNSKWLTNRLRITCPTQPGDFLQLAKSFCRVTHSDFECQKTALGIAWASVACPSESVDPSTVGLSVQHSAESVSPSSDRTWSSSRETKETHIKLDLNLDGSGKIDIETGIGFLDHMLTALAFHAGMDLTLKCDGDLIVDDHHTAEDCALALGTAIDGALGRRTGIKRFGFAYAPLDESLARTVIDLSGRPWPEIHLHLEREMIGTWACENITHFFQSLAMTLKCSLHVDVLRGTNDHHRAEAAFKSLAKALRDALTKTDGDVPSTKGVL